MSNTFRAAYIAAPADGTSGGFLLTTEEDSRLPDADLIAAARPALAAYNADARAIGGIEADESEILIGDFTE